MRAFAAAVLVLATLAAIPAEAEDVTYAGGAIYFYERGTTTTKVDRVPALKLDLYPLTFDAELIGPEFYLQVAGDWIPRLFFAVLPESMHVDEDDYGKDEAFLNFKLGTFLDEKARTSIGYGVDFDTRLHNYASTLGGTADGKDKIRIGLGPNLALRTGTRWLFTMPNVSVYYYPWPNEESEFIPKGKAGWGYRVEVPIILNVSEILGWKSYYLSLAAKPFYGWQGGFHRKDASTGETWNSEATSKGVRFGFLFGPT